MPDQTQKNISAQWDNSTIFTSDDKNKLQKMTMFPADPNQA